MLMWDCCLSEILRLEGVWKMWIIILGGNIPLEYHILVTLYSMQLKNVKSKTSRNSSLKLNPKSESTYLLI